MIANKKEFGGGLAMMVGFWIVFAILLSPVFAGQNLLDYMDGMYNSISKNSSYYIPDAQKKASEYQGKNIDLTIEAGEGHAGLLRKAGMTVSESGAGELAVSGDLGGMLAFLLGDADAMFANNGEAVSSRYGQPEKQVLYGWWSILKSMEKSLTRQENFKESKLLYQVRTKSVEPAYNYYGIKSQTIREKLTVVVLSLAGYVIYTMWFGFAILFMFEGWGLKLEH
jgi:hypothetical protein